MVMLTASNAPSSQTYRSKILSQQRSWAEDGENNRACDYSSDSRPVEDWQATPDAKRRKRDLVQLSDDEDKPVFVRQQSTSTTMKSTDPEVAKAARREAILASMRTNTQPPTSTIASTYTSTSVRSGASSSRTALATTQYPLTATPPLDPSGVTLPSRREHIASPPAAQRSDSKQTLPSLPSAPAYQINSKKSSEPWNESHAATRKIRKVELDRSATLASSGLARRAGGQITIEQKITLSTEQQKVLSLVVAEQKSIFFTGSAGTGKSVLLRELIRNLRRKFGTTADAVAVTASTGIAACNIGGVTLNAFGGVGLGTEPAEVLAKRIRLNKKSAARWIRTKVLIIDEISMVDGGLFDKLCKIGQMLRKSTKPWGGIQLVVTGDFFQLPPVTKGSESVRFCFDAATWPESINMSVNLTKVFRQKDQRFVDMLNEMRFGTVTTQTVRTFETLTREIPDDGRGIEATELFPRREDVEKANKQRIERLPSDGHSYIANDDGGKITDPAQKARLLSQFMAVPLLELRTGAQVMLIKNMDDTLVNGSMGRVIGFEYPAIYMVNHKGEWGAEEEKQDAGISDEDKALRESLRQQYHAKLDRSTAKPCPVVEFKVPGGGRRVHLVEPETFKTELPNGEVQAQRAQLPLILAWAMSIHKSQGQTLEKVKVDLSKVFEKGQAYVALSRATSLEGLQVLGFRKEKVMAHPKVTRWSAKLKDLNSTS